MMRWNGASRFQPPITPATPIDQVVAFYANNRLGILFGEMLVLCGSGLMIPFMVVVFVNVRRIERGFPLLSYTFILCALVVIMEVVIPAWVWRLFATSA